VKRKQRWAVFISGRGSNLQALLDLSGEVETVLVVSSRKQAPGLWRARRAGVPTTVLPKTIDWDDLDAQLRRHRVSAIVLAGFMKIVPESFIERWKGLIFNLHPSLLPLYPGMNSIECSYRDRAAMGVSFHHVVPEVDAGEILLQKQVFKRSEALELGLTLEEAEFFIHVTEHRVMREAIGYRAWI
jgi:phosphoribosylglycinamide formyltransferase 1